LFHLSRFQDERESSALLVLMMDEAFIAERIAGIAQGHYATELTAGIVTIHLKIGERVELNIEQLERSFYILTAGTLLESADLFIERQQTIVCCNVCGATFHPTSRDNSCERCASRDIAVISGDELQVCDVTIAQGVEQ
jgi:hydrogenase nickel incorporation protein HypA/HybF